MRYINNLSEELRSSKQLGSEVRISILNLLLERGKMSMNELAEQLDITNGAMTNHIRKLESADLIRVTSDPNVHGQPEAVRAASGQDPLHSEPRHPVQ